MDFLVNPCALFTSNPLAHLSFISGYLFLKSAYHLSPGNPSLKGCCLGALYRMVCMVYFNMFKVIQKATSCIVRHHFTRASSSTSVK